MKTRILSILAAVAAFLTMLGGLDLAEIISVLPEKVATVFATALPLLAGFVHLIKAIGDFVDDGKINGSFRVLAFFAALSFALMSMSCAVVESTVTGRPIATEPVTAADDTQFNVASSDVLRARQSPPETAWGLYDAGLVAAKAREVISSGK